MRRYLSKNAILYNSLGTQMSEFYNANAAKKTRVMNLPGGRNSMLFWHNTTDGRTDRQNFHIAEAYRPARGYALKTWMKTRPWYVTIFEQPANQVLTLQLYNFTTWRIALMWVLCARNDAYRCRDTCHLHLHEISMFSVSGDCADTAQVILRYVLDNGRNWRTGRRYRLHSRLSS